MTNQSLKLKAQLSRDWVATGLHCIGYLAKHGELR